MKKLNFKYVDSLNTTTIYSDRKVWYRIEIGRDVTRSLRVIRCKQCQYQHANRFILTFATFGRGPAMHATCVGKEGLGIWPML